jgi:hypothetical protein
VPTPAWLHPDDDEMPPPELQELYKNLPLEVTKICETARRSMRDAYVQGLRRVRDALAPHGLFKEWCWAAGINYVTAHSIVRRAEQKERPATPPAEHPTDMPLHIDSLLEPEDPPSEEVAAELTKLHKAVDEEAPPAKPTVPDKPTVPENVNRSLKLTWPLAEYDRITTRLRAVGHTVGETDWEPIIVALVDFWEEHHQSEGEVSHAAA